MLHLHYFDQQVSPECLVLSSLKQWIILQNWFSDSKSFGSAIRLSIWMSLALAKLMAWVKAELSVWGALFETLIYIYAFSKCFPKQLANEETKALFLYLVTLMMWKLHTLALNSDLFCLAWYKFIVLDSFCMSLTEQNKSFRYRILDEVQSSVFISLGS